MQNIPTLNVWNKVGGGIASAADVFVILRSAAQAMQLGHCHGGGLAQLPSCGPHYSHGRFPLPIPFHGAASADPAAVAVTTSCITTGPITLSLSSPSHTLLRWMPAPTPL